MSFDTRCTKNLKAWFMNSCSCGSGIRFRFSKIFRSGLSFSKIRIWMRIWFEYVCIDLWPLFSIFIAKSQNELMSVSELAFTWWCNRIWFSLEVEFAVFYFSRESRIRSQRVSTRTRNSDESFLEKNLIDEKTWIPFQRKHEQLDEIFFNLLSL